MTKRELLAKSFAPIWHDAFARLKNRRDCTARDCQKVFAPLLTGIASAFQGGGSFAMDAFVAKYAENLAHRWNAEIDPQTELARAIREIGEKAVTEALTEQARQAGCETDAEICDFVQRMREGLELARQCSGFATKPTRGGSLWRKNCWTRSAWL